MDYGRKWMIPRFNLKLMVIVWCAVIVTAVVSGMSLSAYTVNKLEERELGKVSSDMKITAENIYAYCERRSGNYRRYRQKQ